MNIQKFYYFSVGLIFLLCWQNVAVAQIAESSPTPELIVSADPFKTKLNLSPRDLIHFGDLIEVDVLGSFEYDWRGNLTPEGFLPTQNFSDKSFYGLCREVDEIAEEIAEEYSKTLRNPSVKVKILDRSKRPNVFLYGAVKFQQKFLINRAVRLNELIIISGGLTDDASGEIQIFRSPSASCSPRLDAGEPTDKDDEANRERFVNISQDNGSPFININISDLLKGNEKYNPRILSGDIITVQRAKPIYVVGGVAYPKTIFWRDEMTLSRAITSAGNVTKDANINNITIIRRGSGGSEIIKADLEKIKNGDVDDIVLNAFDVVDIPQKGKKDRKYSQLREFENSQVNDSSKLTLRIID